MQGLAVVRQEARTPSLFRALSTVVKHEGVLSLWKGNGVTIVHRLPYSAVNFWTYEQVPFGPSVSQVLAGLYRQEAQAALLGRQPLDLQAGTCWPCCNAEKHRLAGDESPQALLPSPLCAACPAGPSTSGPTSRYGAWIWWCACQAADAQVQQGGLTAVRGSDVMVQPAPFSKSEGWRHDRANQEQEAGRPSTTLEAWQHSAWQHQGCPGVSGKKLTGRSTRAYDQNARR